MERYSFLIYFIMLVHTQKSPHIQAALQTEKPAPGGYETSLPDGLESNTQHDRGNFAPKSIEEAKINAVSQPTDIMSGSTGHQTPQFPGFRWDTTLSMDIVNHANQDGSLPARNMMRTSKHMKRHIHPVKTSEGGTHTPIYNAQEAKQLVSESKLHVSLSGDEENLVVAWSFHANLGVDHDHDDDIALDRPHLLKSGMENSEIGPMQNATLADVDAFVVSYGIPGEEGEEYDSSELGAQVRKFVLHQLHADEDYVICVHAMIEKSRILDTCSLWSRWSLKMIVGIISGTLFLLPCIIVLILIIQKDRRVKSRAGREAWEAKHQGLSRAFGPCDEKVSGCSTLVSEPKISPSSLSERNETYHQINQRDTSAAARSTNAHSHDIVSSSLHQCHHLTEHRHQQKQRYNILRSGAGKGTLASASEARYESDPRACSPPTRQPHQNGFPALYDDDIGKLFVPSIASLAAAKTGVVPPRS